MFRIVFAFTLVILASMKIQAHVELKYPVGGETHYPGETVNIVWDETVSHSTLNWDLFYSVDGGLTWTILKEDIATIEFDNPNNDKHSLIIYNIQGGVVRSITGIISGKIDMQRDNMPASRYFIQLRDEKQVRGTGNLVIL